MVLDLALLLGGFVIGCILRYFHAGIRGESWFCRLANRRILAILVCAGVAMLPRLALLPWIPPPIPKMHDEFSYVLGAQTLAAGRLTNPTPAFWQHFESYHINMVPTYQSIYPPAPSLIYALGILVGQNPWWGVWLSTGLMCAAICWALQPIIRPRYAFLAGIFCALRYGVFTVNSDTLLCSSVAALGGALTLGAFVRLTSDGRLRQVLWLALGIALLANSRPFEGLLFAAPIALAALIWILRQQRWRTLSAAAVLLTFLLAAMGYYNWRGTGSALKMPYMANIEQYHLVGPFLGMQILPRPQYHHPEMAAFYEIWEGEPGHRAHTLPGVLSLAWEKIRSYDKEHFSPLLLPCLLGVFVALRLPRRRMLAITFLLVGCGLLSVVWRPLNPYPAPLLVSFFGLSMIGFRHLGALPVTRHRIGPYLARGLVVALLLFGIGRMGVNGVKGIKAAHAYPPPWQVQRARILDDLARRGGSHLLIVRYAPGHSGHEEWVYNSPDIDQQRVILARSMGDEADCRLIRHYAGREVWILEPDARRPAGVLQPLAGLPLGAKCK